MKIFKSIRSLDHASVIGYLMMGMCFLVLGVALVVVLLHGSSAPQSTNVRPTVTALPTLVAQPESAEQVAKNLGCGDFTDLGSAPGFAVQDSGSCWIGGKKYAMDTFTSSVMRDAWLKAATQLGVVPRWETPTSVTYPSVP